jgi:hypothetical protein
MKIRNCLFLLTANYRCHVCHLEQPVVALGTSDLYDDRYGWLPTSEAKPLFILSEVHSAPPEIINLVRSVGVIYEQRGNTCFANCCIHCGARFGDFYLTGQPCGPFLPETIEAASNIELLEILLASELEFDCVYSQAGAHLIRSHAREFRHLRR